MIEENIKAGARSNSNKKRDWKEIQKSLKAVEANVKTQTPNKEK